MEGADGRIRGVALALDVHAVVIDIDDQLAEEGAEQVATHEGIGASKEALWVAKQFEERHGTLCAVAQAFACAAELFSDRLSLHRCPLKPCLDFRHRERAVRGQVDQPLLLGFELVQLLLVIGFGFSVCGQQVSDSASDEISDVIDLSGGQQ